MTARTCRSIAVRSLPVLSLLVMLGCNSSGSNSRTLHGTATFPEQVGGGPVANSRFVVLDLNQPGAPVVAQGTSDANGNWSVPEASGLTVAVVFQREDNAQRVRISGLSRPSDSGFDKPLNGQTDIACEAGVSAILQGIISGAEMNKNLILRLEAMTERFVDTTDYRSPAAVSNAALQVRLLVLGR